MRPYLHLAVFLSFLLTGCSTSALYQARSQFYNGDSEAALATLSNSSVVASQDRLLYWLEKGLILYESGDYEASARELLNAGQYLSDNDYVSVSDQARTLLANDWAARYPAEYSERLWVHSYLMMNFLALGKYDSAAVEARRALDRIESHSDVLDKDTFSRSLIALSFEAAGQLNDAYIEYRKLSEQTGNPPQLDHLLLTQANRLGFTNDAREIKLRLRNSGEPTERQSPSSGKEAVVFVSSGTIPRKVSGSLFTSTDSRVAFPEYYISGSRAPLLQGSINGNDCDCLQVSTDLGHLVSESLSSRATKVAAKTLLRAVSKDAVADAIAEKDEIAGELARLLFFAFEEADTRSWQSLPRHLSLFRIPLPADDATVSLSLHNSNGSSDHERIVLQATPATETGSEALRTPSMLKPTTRGRFRFYQLRIPN